jgi:hypothetical protein
METRGLKYALEAGSQSRHIAADDGSVELDVGVDGHARLVRGKGAKTSRSHCHG